ncbi:MAG: Lrp/AsnC ligand binding domain-containing protein [candidate division Zixibacteria bacterium]|nr:Lrp/AsnC ligand binding domain-containing protein [candidate division Zixibacteria bacterium]
MMSKRFLLLAEVTDHEQLVPATRSLSDVAGVEWWHAVDGHINLVVCLNGDSGQVVSHLTSRAGNMPVATSEILSNGLPLPQLSKDDCHAWVFVEAEPAHLDKIRRHIEGIPGLVFTLTTRGACDLAALIKGPNSAAIDRTIDEQIRPLDGILRLKKNHIINLTTL